MNAKAETAPDLEADAAPTLRVANLEDIWPWEQSNQILRHCPSAATQPADLLLPRYFAACGFHQKIRAGDVIISIPADHSWAAVVMVREIGPDFVRVAPLGGQMFPDPVRPPGAARRASTEDVVTDYGGPLHKWRLIGEGGRVLKSGFNTETEALQWLAAHREMQKRTTKGPA